MPPAMLPPSDHVPAGYVRFAPDGPLFLRAYLAKHPGVEARLRARSEKALNLAAPEPEPSKVIQLRAELAADARVIRYLRSRVEYLEQQLTRATHVRRTDPAEQERRDDVWRHGRAYSAYVLRSMLADLARMDRGSPASSEPSGKGPSGPG